MDYGPVWVDLMGTEISDAEIPILQHKHTGGVLLFTKNYANVAQLQQLVKAIRDYAGKKILIAVDHEGGRKWRFEEGFTKPDAPGNFGNLYKHDPDLALTRLNAAGQIIAHELLVCGIDLTFAPLLDVDVGISSVIGDRSYGNEAWMVTNCAAAFIKGLRQQGMAAVGKHYPGHGGCVMDSHFTAAIDSRSYAEIAEADLMPYVKLHQELAGIMPAHVIYPEVDPHPAGLSEFWLQKILRKEIGFNGAIISDCLSMAGSGFAENIPVGAEQALKAGCDMVIIAQQSRAELLNILDAIPWEMNDKQLVRIEALAGDFANPNLRVRPPIAPEAITS